MQDTWSISSIGVLFKSLPKTSVASVYCLNLCPKIIDTLSITSLPTKLCPKCRIPDPPLELVYCLKLWSKLIDTLSTKLCPKCRIPDPPLELVYCFNLWPKIIESVAASSTPPNSQLHIAHGAEDTQSASRSIHIYTMEFTAMYNSLSHKQHQFIVRG